MKRTTHLITLGPDKLLKTSFAFYMVEEQLVKPSIRFNDFIVGIEYCAGLLKRLDKFFGTLLLQLYWLIMTNIGLYIC